jgi:hypothetical protein
MQNNAQSHSGNETIMIIAGIIMLAFLITCIVLSQKGRLHIYNNYTDFAASVLAMLTGAVCVWFVALVADGRAHEIGAGYMIIVFLCAAAFAASIVFIIRCSIVYNASPLYIALSIMAKLFFVALMILILVGGAVQRKKGETERAYRRRQAAAIAASAGLIVTLQRLCVQRREYVPISDCWHGM